LKVLCISMHIVGVIQIIFFNFKWLDDGSYVILCLYVDDMLVVGSNMDHIKELKHQLEHSFSMKDLEVEKKIFYEYS